MTDRAAMLATIRQKLFTAVIGDVMDVAGAATTVPVPAFAAALAKAGAEKAVERMILDGGATTEIFARTGIM